MKQHTAQEFISLAKKRHGNQYGYEYVKYVNSKTLVTITCLVHGEFKQKPNSHLRGRGCNQCNRDAFASRMRATTTDFILKAKNIHGDRYCYNMVNYRGSFRNIDIRCSVHGFFQQTPSTHLSGSGCRKCGLLSAGEQRNRIARDNFIEKATAIHSGIYGYENVSYIDNETKIKIQCRIHGEFKQRPSDHLAGKGCRDCAIQSRVSSLKKNTSIFVKESTKIHGNLYDYTKTIYINNKTKVEIMCRRHGVFLQQTNAHLRGQGCPTCGNRTSRMETTWLDSLGINDRQVALDVGSKRYYVDGYNAETKTVYEFHGDYWHGNPQKYSNGTLNEKTGQTMGEHFLSTIDKESALRDAGYKVVVMWESEWKRCRRSACT